MKKVLICVSFCICVCLTGVQDCYAENDYSVPEDITRLLERGKFDEARLKLENFRRKSPDNPLAIFYLARLEKDINKASALYKEVEILADSSLAAKAVFERAGICFAGGDMTAAGELYKRVIAVYPLTPPYAESLYRMGIIRLISGETEEARVHFKLCLEQNPEDYLRVLAAAGVMECHVVLKDWKDALESARDVLEKTDEDNTVTPRVLEVIALSWSKLGNEDNARHYTERLLKQYPESYQAHAARESGNYIAGETIYSIEPGSAMNDSLTIPGHAGGNRGSSGDVGIIIEKEKAKFSVQASAFSVKENALRLFNRLKEAKFEARISLKTVANEHFYLVQVGYFKTREEAEKMADRVTKFTGIKAHTIRLE